MDATVQLPQQGITHARATLVLPLRLSTTTSNLVHTASEPPQNKTKTCCRTRSNSLAGHVSTRPVAIMNAARTNQLHHDSWTLPSPPSSRHAHQPALFASGVAGGPARAGHSVGDRGRPLSCRRADGEQLQLLAHGLMDPRRTAGPPPPPLPPGRRPGHAVVAAAVPPPPRGAARGQVGEFAPTRASTPAACEDPGAFGHGLV